MKRFSAHKEQERIAALLQNAAVRLRRLRREVVSDIGQDVGRAAQAELAAALRTLGGFRVRDFHP